MSRLTQSSATWFYPVDGAVLYVSTQYKRAQVLFLKKSCIIEFKTGFL